MVDTDTVGMDIVGESLAEDRGSESVLEALSLVDAGLSKLQSRELVSASEVADLLLDLRVLLTAELAADDGAEKVLSAN